ncbi:MAG TPA: prolyl oligopeptidase family serine peptidase [Chitinophagaceae bacterium]|nr:prolyl oligopeptidase family serine peptidase [Chitinophagaceae bacterium]
MKKIFSAIVLSMSLLTLSAQLKYPVTAKTNQTDNYFGTVVADPYRWLENDNSDSTKAWVKEQNMVTNAYLNQIPYRDGFKKRIETVSNYAKYSSPQKKGEWFYFYKNDGLQNQSVLYRQKGLDGKADVVIDPNKLSPDGTTRLIGFVLNKNGNYAAWGISKGGSDWQTYFVRDMQTGKDLTDEIDWVKVSGIAWQGDGFYYSRYPATAKGKELSTKNENHQVWFHVVGTNQSADKLIFEDKANPQRFHTVSTSDDERFVYLTISDRGKGFDGNALWYIDNRSADKIFKPIVKEAGKFDYGVIDNINDKILIQTNDAAQNSKVIEFDPAKPQQKDWKIIIPEKAEPLQGVGSVGGKLFVTYLKDVTSRIYVYDYKGNKTGEVKLPALGNASGFGGEKEDAFTFYTFSTFNFPPTIYKYDVANGKSSVFQKPELSFNPADYTVDQIFYTSKDKTKIPMFIVAKKGMIKNGKNPTILYGYGGFNISMTPAFSAFLIPWLEQGGIYAVANIRGGSEYGEKWHEAGMKLKKQNVFDDFIAAGEYLIAQKYTSSNYLALRGGSNGGLLVGAVINQRPGLAKVAIPQVGVMDMLRFQKFTIGWNWIADYGSSDNAGEFKVLYAYSPLQNIKQGVQYPATLITTADHDDRVVPAHSFKYAATLQEKNAGKNPTIIRIDTNSGHGASNMAKNIETTADIYSFILFNMGVMPKF